MDGMIGCFSGGSIAVVERVCDFWLYDALRVEVQKPEQHIQGVVGHSDIIPPWRVSSEWPVTWKVDRQMSELDTPRCVGNPGFW
jgi:hypothetical protein